MVVAVTKASTQYQRENHAVRSLKGMHEYFKAGRLCDITLIAGTDQKKILAHRVVLSAANPFFHELFMNNRQKKEIELNDISGDVLEALISYCYIGQIEIRDDNVEEIHANAILMKYPEVAQACSEYLSANSN